MSARSDLRTQLPWVGLVALCWLPAFTYFFAQEDFEYILRAQELGWRAWLPAGPLARPLVFGGWMQLGRVLCDLDPVRWHAANVAVHVGSTIMLGLVLRRLRLPPGQAVAGLLLYGLAPVHYNTVVWVQNIHPALAASLSLAAIYAGLGPPGPRAITLCTLWYLLALASNEMAVAMAPVLVVLEWARGTAPVAALRRHALVVGLTGAYVLWRLSGHGGAAESDAHQQLYTLTLGMNVVENAGRYGLVFFSPVWLAWTALRGREWIYAGPWVGAACAAIALGMSIRAARRTPPTDAEAPPPGRVIVAAWLWMGAALAPSLVLTSFYPYRGAFGAAGFALLVCAWWRPLASRAGARALLAAGLVAVLAVAWRVVPVGDTLRVRDKQAIARQVLTDLEVYVAAHPDTVAVHIPSLLEPYGLGAAATYWGRAVELFFPQVQWVETREAVRQPTVVFHVEAGRLVPREQWRPHG